MRLKINQMFNKLNFPCSVSQSASRTVVNGEMSLRRLKLSIFEVVTSREPIPEAERSKAWVCSRSPAGIAGSNSAEGMDVCLL